MSKEEFYQRVLLINQKLLNKGYDFDFIKKFWADVLDTCKKRKLLKNKSCN